MEKDHQAILEIINNNTTSHPDSSLYLAVLFLTPLYFYAEDGDAMMISAIMLNSTEIVFKNDLNILDVIPF